jgi:hypothetical protein
MHRGFLPAFGALAFIGAVTVAQTSAAQEPVMRMRPIIMFPQFPQPPQAPQPPPVGFRGCVYFEHVNWQGKWRSIPGGTRRKDVGKTWDNAISSFACSPQCRVVAFDQNFKGDRVEFATVPNVGNWNDKIGSMIASCQHPF